MMKKVEEKMSFDTTHVNANQLVEKTSLFNKFRDKFRDFLESSE